MALPEVIVQRGDRGPAQVPADDVATFHVAAITERGPAASPVDCRTWAQVRDTFGDHTSYSTLRAVEACFAAGGGRVVLSRVVGPEARAATLALRDRDSAAVLTVTATGPGAWYDGLRVVVTRGDGDDRVITITLDGATLSSGTARDADDAKDIIDASGYATGVAGAGVWPISAISETALSGGDDDRGDITDREVAAALDAIPATSGAGTIAAAGWTSVATHRALAAHAAGRNRFARGDLPDVASAATLIAAARQVQALDDAEHIQLLAGWPIVLVGGVEVPIPPSGVLCGREARTDREAGQGPGQPAAWTFGDLPVVGVSQSWTDEELTAMLAAGITPIVQDPDGRVWALDAITATDAIRFPQYREVAAMRVTMAVHQQAQTALKQRVMQVIDGHGHLASAAESDLVAICDSWYQRGALYGAEAAEAYRVAVVADAARRSLTGTLVIRPSSSVQTVTLTITQVASGDVI